MNRTGGGILAMAVLVAVFTGGGVHRQQEPVPVVHQVVATNSNAEKPVASPKKPPAGGEQSVAQEDGLADQMTKLRETVRDATTTSLTDTQQTELAAVLNGVGADNKIGFMIAIVPDPVKTHLSLAFDRYIEAMQQGIQKSCFDFDRALLPWDEQTREEPSSPITREKEHRFSGAEEEVPGVLIFRKHHLPPNMPEAARDCPEATGAQAVETLLVFVVGEMPTAGVEKSQFTMALQFAQKFSVGGGPEPPLFILGPNFSGSLYSLQQLLIEQATKYPRIVIASGQVTGDDSVRSFKAGLQAAGLGGKVNFASFNESSSVLEEALFRYACDEWSMKPREFAILSESETAFGQESAPVAREVCPQFHDADLNPIKISFPRGIYHLRTAYGEQFPDGLPQEEQRPRVRSNLKPNLEEQRRASDSVPDFSSQSTVSQDGMLMDLVDDLQKHRSQLLLVVASDPLDSLFLVRYIRQHYAYGRLVILGPDALLRHESDDPQIRGILTISSYSLIHSNGKPSGREGHATTGINFPDDSSIATYNAAVVLSNCLGRSETEESKAEDWCKRSISDGKGEARNDPPLPADLKLLGYNVPSPVVHDPDKSGKCCRPQIHLESLGRDGFWPVAELSDGRHSWLPRQEPASSSCGSENPPNVPPSDTFSLPLPWEVMVVSLLVGLSFLGICLYRASLLSAYEPEVLLSPAPIRHEPDPGTSIRKTLIGCFFASSLLMLGFAVWPMFSSHVEMDAANWLLAAAVVLVSGWVIYVVGLQSRRQAMICIAAFALPVVFALGERNDAAFQILLYHSAQVGSQLSPLLPFVVGVLSLLWWIWYSISGCVLTDLRRPRLPSVHGGLPEELRSIAEEDHRGLRRALLPASADMRIWIPAAAVLFIVMLLTYPARAIRSLEPAFYDRLLLGLLITSFVLLLESSFRVMTVWMSLRRLLRALDGHPFRHMIGRIGGFSWKSIWMTGSGSLTTAHCLILRQIDALRVVESKVILPSKNVAEEDELFPKSLMGRVWQIYFDLLKAKDEKGMTLLLRDLQTQAIAAPATPVKGKLDGSETGLLNEFGKLQERLAGAAGWLLCALLPYYKRNPEIACELDIASTRELQGHPPNSPKGILEYYVCMVYINYIVSALLRIRGLAMAAVGIYVLDVVALNSYPFEPRAILRSLTFGVLLALTTCFGVVYAQMHRDPVLSRITDTNPGELGADFWVRMLAVTGVPLASLLASEFPSIGDFLFSWIEPVTKALR